MGSAVERRPEVPWGPLKAEAIDGRMDDGIIQRQARVSRGRAVVRWAWYIVDRSSRGASKPILVAQPSIRWKIIVEIVPSIIRSRGRRRPINVAQTVLIENIGKDSVFFGTWLRVLRE